MPHKGPVPLQHGNGPPDRIARDTELARQIALRRHAAAPEPLSCGDPLLQLDGNVGRYDFRHRLTN
jgi:hypothetical protein